MADENNNAPHRGDEVERGVKGDRKREGDRARLPRLDPKAGIHLGYWVIAALVLMLVQNLWTTARDVETVPYSRFEQLLQQGALSDVQIDAQTLTGTLKGTPTGKPARRVVAVRVDPALAAELQHYGVRYAQVYESTWLANLLSWIVPALVFFGVWYFMVRRFADRHEAAAQRPALALGEAPHHEIPDAEENQRRDDPRQQIAQPGAFVDLRVAHAVTLQLGRQRRVDAHRDDAPDALAGRRVLERAGQRLRVDLHVAQGPLLQQLLEATVRHRFNVTRRAPQVLHQHQHQRGDDPVANVDACLRVQPRQPRSLALRVPFAPVVAFVGHDTPR